MTRTFNSLRKQVESRGRERQRTLPHIEFLGIVAGALWELNMFHVKRVEDEIAAGRPMTPADESFLTAAADYRKVLEQWLQK